MTQIATETIAERVGAELEQCEFDAIVAIGYASFQYLSGYWFPYARSFPNRQNLIVWPAGGEPVMLVGRDQVAGPKRDSWISDIRAYDQLGRRPPGEIPGALAAILRELDLVDARIGIETLATPLAFANELRKELPETELVPCDEFLDTLRSIKTAQEVEIITRCSHAIEQGLMAAFGNARVGWTEKQLHDAICYEILQRGPSNILLVTVQSGEAARGFFPTSHNVMSEFVRTDATAILDGYFADMARMAFVGAPTAEQEQTYQRQLELNAAIVESMRPGVPASRVYDRCRAEAARLELELLPQPSIGLGHTIGLNSQDLPALKPGEETLLAPGMVFAIEPDTIGPDGELVHVEEMVLVGAEEAVVLTSTEDWSELPRIGG
jgi:Xaa-Pro aminopeptidase